MLLLKNGLIWDGLGNDPYKADILIVDGVIQEIASDIQCEEAKKIDIEGNMILPGFIDSLNVYGCRGPGWGDNDLVETSDPVLPNMNVVFSFDQDAMNFQEIYRYGVTAAGITPSPANVLAGKAAVFYSYGRHPYKMLIKEEIAQIASVTAAPKKTHGSQNKQPMTRMGSFSQISEMLTKAKGYLPENGYDAKLDALQPVLSGKMPLFINCATRSEMKNVLHLMKEFPEIKVVLTGAFGLDFSFTEVEQGKVPVILGDLTDAFSPYGENVNFKDLNSLLQNGAKIACSSCGDSFASGKESLLWNGIQWYKNGIAANEVLKSMTSVPAEILGISERTGSIQVGKSADFVVWSDNPIKTYCAKVRSVYIKGESILDKEVYDSCW